MMLETSIKRRLAERGHYRCGGGAAVLLALPAGGGVPARAQVVNPQEMQAAIHPVATSATLARWPRRVPLTKAFPPDLEETLRGQSDLYVVGVTTAPGCLPCGDLWSRLSHLGRRYSWLVCTISQQDALLRSGRLGPP